MKILSQLFGKTDGKTCPRRIEIKVRTLTKYPGRSIWILLLILHRTLSPQTYKDYHPYPTGSTSAAPEVGYFQSLGTGIDIQLSIVYEHDLNHLAFYQK